MVSERTGSGDILIGIDAGTSVIEAVAFDLGGRQIGASAIANRYDAGRDGSATQSLEQTWVDCIAALRASGEIVERLDSRAAALAVAAQGDGTWPVGRDNARGAGAWLRLDARAAPTIVKLNERPNARARFEATGTGLNTCQQSSQLAHMDGTQPEVLDRAARWSSTAWIGSTSC